MCDVPLMGAYSTTSSQVPHHATDRPARLSADQQRHERNFRRFKMISWTCFHDYSPGHSPGHSPGQSVLQNQNQVHGYGKFIYYYKFNSHGLHQVEFRARGEVMLGGGGRGPGGESGRRGGGKGKSARRASTAGCSRVRVRHGWQGQGRASRSRRGVRRRTYIQGLTFLFGSFSS